MLLALLPQYEDTSVTPPPLYLPAFERTCIAPRADSKLRVARELRCTVPNEGRTDVTNG